MAVSAMEGMKFMDQILSVDKLKRFMEQVSSRVGCLYCWPTKENGYSGKDLTNAKFPRTYDCSGLVTASLFAATGIDVRATHNANRLMKNCKLVTDPKPGDLAFYGPARGRATHVMVVDQDGGVVGASGGNQNTVNPQVAQATGAMVKRYASHNYRKDFLCFGRLSTVDR